MTRPPILPNVFYCAPCYPWSIMKIDPLFLHWMFLLLFQAYVWFYFDNILLISLSKKAVSSSIPPWILELGNETVPFLPLHSNCSWKVINDLIEYSEYFFFFWCGVSSFFLVLYYFLLCYVMNPVNTFSDIGHSWPLSLKYSFPLEPLTFLLPL